MVNLLNLTEAEERTKEITAFAERPENWYRIGQAQAVPGDRAEYILISGTIRAVFSWTWAPKVGVFRHMTVSIRGASDRGPNPVVVWTLAHMFGFTGAVATDGIVQKPSKTWGLGVDHDEGCIVVQEKIDPQPTG